VKVRYIAVSRIYNLCIFYKSVWHFIIIFIILFLHYFLTKIKLKILAEKKADIKI